MSDNGTKKRNVNIPGGMGGLGLPPIMGRLFEGGNGKRIGQMPKPKRPGQPTKLTRKRMALIAEFIIAGNDIKTAAIAAGVSRPVFYHWMKQGRIAKETKDEGEREKLAIYAEFLDAMEQAIAASKVLFVQTIAKASGKSWTAAAWMLERRYPNEFGDPTKRIEEEEEGEGKAASKEPYRVYMPAKDAERADVLCTKCSTEFFIVADEATSKKAESLWPTYCDVNDVEGDYDPNRLLIEEFYKFVHRKMGEKMDAKRKCGC